MVEPWHTKFNPKFFLARVNIDRLINRNVAYNANRVEKVTNPCILCNEIQGPGLLLNDNSYICKKCFTAVSSIKYPEKYERLRREYIRAQEARRQAREAFVK